MTIPFLLINEELKTAICKNEMFITKLKEKGEQKGKSNLHKQGLKKVIAGITSLEELQRVLE
jgi:type II secretory ATPase GspE/PulE/Tfp pilus assembly ATPase PilB-like protein